MPSSGTTFSTIRYSNPSVATTTSVDFLTEPSSQAGLIALIMTADNSVPSVMPLRARTTTTQPTTNAITPSSNTATSSNAAQQASSRDQATDKRLSIALGVAIGAVAVIVMAVLFCCLCRRKRATGSFFVGRRASSTRTPSSIGWRPPAQDPSFGTVSTITAGDGRGRDDHARRLLGEQPVKNQYAVAPDAPIAARAPLRMKMHPAFAKRQQRWNAGRRGNFESVEEETEEDEEEGSAFLPIAAQRHIVPRSTPLYNAADESVRSGAAQSPGDDNDNANDDSDSPFRDPSALSPHGPRPATPSFPPLTSTTTTTTATGNPQQDRQAPSLQPHISYPYSAEHIGRYSHSRNSSTGPASPISAVSPTWPRAHCRNSSVIHYPSLDEIDGFDFNDRRQHLQGWNGAQQHEDDKRDGRGWSQRGKVVEERYELA